MNNLLAPKQTKFIQESVAKINLAHGSVRCGKTVATTFRFFQAARRCPDSQIWMIGKTSETIYDNVVRLVLEAKEDGTDPLAIYKDACTWFPGKRELHFADKVISTVGVKDASSIASIQGKTFSLCYCDEMTLYSEPIIDMIQTRLSNPHSMLFASMNPAHPGHKLKQWIDKAESGDLDYYSLHFTLDDNPYVSESYKEMIRNSLSGVFYKRNYLGLWCMAEGAIFDFFDRKLHVVTRPPKAAEYWIAGIDYGTSNAFACVLIGVNSGRFDQEGRRWWVEKEYYWDSSAKGRQKTNLEYANDVEKFLEPYGVKQIYIDPSAAAFKVELRRKGMHCIDANNEVLYGIQLISDELNSGNLTVCSECKNLINEIEGYVWDTRKCMLGDDAPLKQKDHAIDAMRYCIATHKVQKMYLYEDKNFGKTLGFR